MLPLFAAEAYFTRSGFSKYAIGITQQLLFHFIAGNSLLNDVSILAITSLLVLNALWLSIPWLIYVWVKHRFNLSTAMAIFVSSSLTLEFMRSHWGLVCPWFDLGNSISGTQEVIQWYEFTGVAGGTLWILVANCIGFWLVSGLFVKGGMLLWVRGFAWLITLIFPVATSLLMPVKLLMVRVRMF